MLRIALAALLVAGAAGTGVPGTPHIAAVLPNPVAADDRGEYVVLAFPAPTDLRGWSLTDGETTVRFPARTVSGRVVATTDPAAVANWTTLPVVALSGHLALANDGDEVTLRDPAGPVDRVRYRSAPEGRRYVRTETGWRWEPEGATHRPVVTARDVRLRTFVLPDAPDVPVAVLQSAESRLLLAGYTVTAAPVGEALCAASRRGVAVSVLVEGEPVGGMTRREAVLLDAVAACGATVTVLGGPHARYDFHHAKYAVVDDRALVLTENWKPSGTGGRSSRGWGAVVDDPAVADALVATFRADAGWRDGIPWRDFRDGRRYAAGVPPPETEYPPVYQPEPVVADRVDVLVTPDNAEGAVIELLAGAEASIHVLQVSIGSPTHPFVRALVAAARRGVAVKVLLSGAWYAEDGNRAFARELTARANREGLPIAVRVAQPRSRFGKIHAKGIVVDGRRAVVGSMNWNNVSVRENREVMVVLHGEAAAGYYDRVFLADWRGGRWRLPVGVAAFAAAAAGVAAAVGRRTTRFAA